MKVRVMILTGYGINADKELAWAFEKTGAEPEIVHLENLIENKNMLKKYQILAFPGGFSFGDHIASGKIFANILKNNLMEELCAFIKSKKLVIGICNGFQIITKLGIVPDMDNTQIQSSSLVENDSGHFENRWVWVKTAENKSPWLTGIEKLYLPVRHGEGKFITKDNDLLNKIVNEKLIALKYFNPGKNTAEYPFNPNGSTLDIAGITNAAGNVFGLMPHPEAFIFNETHPNWSEDKKKKPENGMLIFKNGVKYFK